MSGPAVPPPYLQRAERDCAPYHASLSPAAKRDVSRRIDASSGGGDGPEKAPEIGAVVGVGAWRLVWARPAGMEPGVFIFHAGALVDTWGGVETDRGDAVRYAARLGMPAGLAQCFASRLVAEGP